MIHRGSAHYRLSLAGGGTDLGEGEGLCITLSLPWRCHVTRYEMWGYNFSMVEDPDWRDSTQATEHHPVLGHLHHVDSHHHFIVTHELSTRVGLGSSAALALAATGSVPEALRLDSAATGAGWQDVWGCHHAGYVAFGRDGDAIGIQSWMYVLGQILLFSTGGTHTEPRNASELAPVIRALALAEARRLRDVPTLETLAWCMQAQWERKIALVPQEVCNAINAAREVPGFMSAKSTGSRGAGFGVVLTKDRERTRDALVEAGARVWMP